MTPTVDRHGALHDGRGRYEVKYQRDAAYDLEQLPLVDDSGQTPVIHPPDESVPDYSSDNWWPRAVNPFDLPAFSGHAWHHVILGNNEDNGGGHEWEAMLKRGYEHKTAFPEGWGAAEIGVAVAEVLRKSARRQGYSAASSLPSKSRHLESVTIGGARLWLQVRLDHDAEGVGVITAHPLNGDGVAWLHHGVLIYLPYNLDQR